METSPIDECPGTAGPWGGHKGFWNTPRGGRANSGATFLGKVLATEVARLAVR